MIQRARGMRVKLCLLVTVLLMILLLLASGCFRGNTEESGETVLPEEMAVPGFPEEGPGWFSDSLRWLTDDEKDRVIEIALNTPEALGQLEKESAYQARLSWIAILWESEAQRSFLQWWGLDYDTVEEGIPEYVSKSATIYSRVVIDFGEPPQWQVSVAVDPDTEKVVLVEENPYRYGPTMLER